MARTDPANQSVGDLIAQAREGNREAADDLMQALYPELRRIAASRMKGERPDHTWQPTVLVHELYLELLRSNSLRGNADPREKAAFFGLAGHMMMRLLIHHSRPLYRRVQKLSIAAGEQLPRTFDQNLDGVETLLDDLARVDPQLRAVVEMKVFEGLSVEEMGARLGCSTRTVERRWNFARHWLATQLGKSASVDGAA
jgi:RNA polymerase sigma factor (TIGR02999 family)